MWGVSVMWVDVSGYIVCGVGGCQWVCRCVGGVSVGWVDVGGYVDAGSVGSLQVLTSAYKLNLPSKAL